MLLNLTNHPYEKWPENQRKYALIKYTEIYDLSFPDINPDEDENDIYKLVVSYRDKCLKIFEEKSYESENAVHIMGEFTFTFALVSLLLNDGINCVASTTKRKVKELENNKREVTFEFIRFREYRKI